MDLIPNFLLRKYDSVEFLDEGAHAKAYECTRLGVTTAVKILNALDPKLRTRFNNEVEILKSINHENVVRVLDVGETEGNFWYESEFADQGHFGVMHSYLFYGDSDAVRCFRQICLGVQVLHNSVPPIIHRDLKPSNILVFSASSEERHPILKIADFGIAAILGDASKLTASGVALGTGAYMAPERVKNPRIKTIQSDIYSLGITFLEACTGHTTQSPDTLQLVPEILRPIIEKMVRLHPPNRYQSVEEVLEALSSLPFERLLFGREIQKDESAPMIFQVNIGRLLENALDALHRCSFETVLDRLADLNSLLDRLGDAHDHEAYSIVNIPRTALSMIEQVNSDALLRLVERFENAARRTKARDWFAPSPSMWSHFLAYVFAMSSYTPARHLCLEILVTVLDRFGDPSTRETLYHTIEMIEDPGCMQHLAICFQASGREDIAIILDGAPDQRVIDFDALRIAL